MFYLFFLLVSSLPALKSLFSPGFFDSFDGGFHLVRLIHFYNEITQGQFPVRFGTQMAFGFGYPVFNFFYPLVYYLGSLIHFFGFSFGSSLKLIIAASFILSAIFCYHWLRQYFNSIASLAGAFLYIYSPYRFSVNFVSTSMGTILAFVFAPLLMLGITKYLIKKNKSSLSLISISTSLLLLSHNVSAMIFISIAVFYINYLIIIFRPNFRQIKNIIYSLILAFGLASFFIIPMVHDLKYVKLSSNIAFNYFDHFPTFKQLIYSPWGYGSSITGPNDKESFQIGIAQWFILGFSTFLFFIKSITQKIKSNTDKIFPFFLFAFLITIFFMLSESNLIWQHLKIIQQIQYPWRLLMATTLIAPFFTAWAIDNLKKNFRPFFFLFITLLAFYCNRNHFLTPNFYRYPDQHYIENQNLFYGSTDIAWESRPIWSNFTPNKFPQTPFITNPDILKYQILKPKPGQRLNLQTDTQNPTTLTLNQYYYPNWLVKNNNQVINSYPDPQNGLLTIDVPQGSNNITINYQSTPVQNISNYISLISFAILIFLILKPRIRTTLFSSAKISS